MGKIIAVAAVGATLGATASASAAVVRRHTPSGTSRARALLLHRLDLGAAWSTAAPAPSKTPELTCTAFNPRTSRVIERGAASSATFAQSAGGPFFAQVGYVYAAPAQEQELWGKVVRPDLGRCFKQSLVAGSGGGVRYTAAGVKRLSLPKLAVSAAAYRVTGTAATTDQTLPVYLDAIVFGHGADISEISLSSFDQPVARGLEVRLARAVARRLAPGA